MDNTFVDLHCHYLPGIDDGVRTFEEGVALCRALRSIGFERVVATPHIRSAMFENRRSNIETEFAHFVDATKNENEFPTLLLGAEHFFDDVFWELFLQNDAVVYSGGRAILVEFPRERIPLGIEQRFFEMQVKGIRPILAHPERYRPFFRKSDGLRDLVRLGALPLLDVMSLTGKYGRRPKKAAQRMLDEALYGAACSDCHRPKDVELVAKGIELLRRHVGDTSAEKLLSIHPRKILDGHPVEIAE